MDNRTAVIIPAYNEETGIGITLDKIVSLDRHDIDIIVVDDGSTDGTVAEASKRAGISVLSHSINKGKGESLKMAIASTGCRYIVWIDADDTYPADSIPLMINMLQNGYDAVVCSRRYGRENIPAFNRIGLWAFRVIICGIFRFKAFDPCTGLYGIKREYLMDMNLTAKRFAIEPEVSMKCGRMKLMTLDIPISYNPRVGSTNLNAIVAGFEDLFMIIRTLPWRPVKSH